MRVSGRVAVVVPSYNRPRLLAEALASLEGAGLVVVVDDGSDFDLEAVKPATATTFFLCGPRKSPEERMTIPSCGRLINNGLRLAANIRMGIDYAAVLSDDDLLAPGWLQAAAAALDANPKWHMVAGRWGLFNDGDEPDPTKLLEITFPLPLTAGNFVYRVSCATVEQCWWAEDSLAVHDGAMLHSYCQVHRTRRGKAPWLGVLPILAGYRRDHPKTVSRHSVFGGDQYTPDVAAMFATPGGME